METFDRKYDTWEFYDAAIVPEGLKFDVRVRGPVNKADASMPIEFYVESDAPKVSAVSTSLEDLRTQLHEQLREWYKVRWEKRICVKFVTGTALEHRRTAEGEFAPKVDVIYFEHGYQENNPNAVYHRESNSRGATKGGYEPSTWGDVAHWVILPDTPQARAVIEGVTTDLEQFWAGALAKLQALGKWENANIGAVTLAESEARVRGRR